MASPQPDFATLFREQYPRIYRYVRYRIDDDAIAEDLTAEIFERAYRALHSYDPERGAFSTWITRIAQNWVNNHLTSRKQQAQYEMNTPDDMEHIPHSDATPELQLLEQESIQRLLGCVERLGARARQVVALRFGSNIRNKEIAALLDMKEHTVSVILLRALEQLRQCQEQS